MNADERRFLAGNSGFNLSSQFVDTTLEILAHQDEGRPVIRVGIPAANFSCRLLDRLCLILVGLQGFIEKLHKLRRAPIIDIPQRNQDALRAGVEETADQAKQFIADWKTSEIIKGWAKA